MAGRKAHTHPQLWEWQVQARIREAKVPRPWPELMLLGLLEEQLVGVVWSESKLYDGGPRMQLGVIAVHVDYRRCGIGLSGVTESLVRTARAYPTADRIQLEAEVHCKNTASIGLMRRLGLRIDRLGVTFPYERWAGPIGVR